MKAAAMSTPASASHHRARARFYRELAGAAHQPSTVVNLERLADAHDSQADHIDLTP